MLIKQKRKIEPTLQVRDANRAVTAFRTALGWMAAEFAAAKLVRLTFGHASKGAALAVLGTKTTDELSREQQRAVELLIQFAADGSADLQAIEVDYGSTTEFQRKVLDGCRGIPPGETLSYGELAVIAGAPGAARAVGNVMKTNKLPLVVPCHRVVGSGGLGGYSAPAGLAMKKKLLAREKRKEEV
jgi:methylated-DNA-[protein]-cysteine S-methyltransferase